jgi:hypothetical protein
MDKFEYSDLYKFLVSAGIVLIGLAILAPWFYLKEPFDLLVEKQKISLLTEQAQNVITNRQNLISHSYSIVPWISVGLFVIGVISIVYGLYKWFIKQADIDKRERLTTQKLENEVKNMTPKQVAEKTEKEFKEATGKDVTSSTTTTTTTRGEFISKYLQIEQALTSKLISLFQRQYRVLPNQRIDRFEYDLILNSVLSQDNDIIFELKYFPNGFNYQVIRETLMRLQMRTNVYAEKVKTNVKPVILIVVPERIYSEKLLENVKKVKDEAKYLKMETMKIELLVEERLEEKSDEILNTVIAD